MTERLFIALPLPDAVRALVASLRERQFALRWTPVEQLHLTLRFIGDVEIGALERLTDQLSRVRVEPFLLPLEGAGAFPAKGPPRVLWVGVGSGHPRLHQLRQRVDDALLAAGLEVDLRTFHPHVTLARCREGDEPDATRWLRRHAEFAGPVFQVEAFDLFSSELHSDGAVQHLRQRFPLHK